MTTKKRKKLTARQRVLRKYKTSWAWKCGKTYYVDKDGQSGAVGWGETRKAAWEDAARRIKAGIKPAGSLV